MKLAKIVGVLAAGFIAGYCCGVIFLRDIYFEFLFYAFAHFAYAMAVLSQWIEQEAVAYQLISLMLFFLSVVIAVGYLAIAYKKELSLKITFFFGFLLALCIGLLPWVFDLIKFTFFVHLYHP